MAIAFKPPEITAIGHNHHHHHQQPSPPSSPLPGPGSGPAVMLPSSHSLGVSDVTVTDSVPRLAGVTVQHVLAPPQQSTIVPVQSVTFHPQLALPPVFMLCSPSSSSPPPVLRIVTSPRRICTPADNCSTCRDIQRGVYIYFLGVMC